MCRGRKIVDHFPPLIFHKIKKLWFVRLDTNNPAI
jgi:hypothetical protein